MRVSVAIPLFNEREVVPELLRRVETVLAALPGGPHEVVVVDDGSTDGTRDLLVARQRDLPGLRVILLSRNFGHQAAITAALDHVTGDAVVVMDGDLQDPPEVIPAMLAAHRDGADVVYAVRASRQEGILLRAAYGLFYRALQRASRVPIPVDAGDFALLSARVVGEFRRLPERHRFLRGMRAWIGFRQVALPVDRPVRAAGTSKYTLRGLVRLAFDGLFAFSVWPIRLAMVAGGIGAAGAGAFALYASILRVATGRVPEGFTAILVVMVFLASVHLMFLGVVGEYVGRIYDEVKQRPVYVVDRIVGESPGDG